MLQARLPEGVHGRHARLADGLDARRQRRADHERRRACRDRAPARPRPGFPVAVHAIGDRANREALDAFEQTRDVGRRSGCGQRIEHAQLLAPEDIAALRASSASPASVQFSHAPSDRDLADRVLGGQDRRRLRLPVAARLRARCVANGSRRADRGARPARRDPRRRAADDRRPPAVAPRAGGHGRRGVPGDVRRARLARAATSGGAAAVPGTLADLVVLDRDPWDDLDAQVVATMVGGRWVHNPPALVALPVLRSVLQQLNCGLAPRVDRVLRQRISEPSRRTHDEAPPDPRPHAHRGAVRHGRRHGDRWAKGQLFQFRGDLLARQLDQSCRSRSRAATTPR